MKLAVASPSSAIAFSEARQQRYQQGLANMQGNGFTPVVMPNATYAEGYLTGTAEAIADLLTAYTDPEISAIICANGGWNINRLLPHFPWDQACAANKPLIGFSDISVLQNALHAKTGNTQLHGPLVGWGFAHNHPTTVHSLRQALLGEDQTFPTATFGTFWRGQSLSGTLVGGNLVSLATLLGTPYAPSWHGKIFFWEETEETCFRLERALTHFQNAGVWNQIAGMVIGQLDQIDTTNPPAQGSVEAMLKAHFAPYSFPILKSEMFGHIAGVNITLPIGGTIVANSQTVTLKNS